MARHSEKGDLHDVALGVGPDGAHHAAEKRVVLGEVFLEGFDDRAHLPHEDARIPEKLSGLQEHPCQFDVGLLGEALDLADGLVVRDLDVAVARVGTCGLDAHGHQRIVLEAKARHSAMIIRKSSSLRIRWSAGVTIISASGLRFSSV